jgi:hypothetical protein
LAVQRFLLEKLRTLRGRARRLATLTPERVGLRAGDRLYAPTAAHFAAANRRLAAIDRQVAARLAFLEARWRRVSAEHALVDIALVERELDRARRTFGMLFEVFSQRGTTFAPTLAAYDAIAADCYAACRRQVPEVVRGPLIAPLSYMEHGYSPATTRRGVALARLLGDTNPFPLIRIPWDRDNPWQSVFLHEVAHNLQADLGLWHENQDALTTRLLGSADGRRVVSVYRRWHKEIFADLAALLLGGPAAAWGMLEFLAHPSSKALAYRPGGPHPTGYLRGWILAEMLERMEFAADAGRVRQVWTSLYRPELGHRIPPELLQTARTIIPAVVDEVAFQARLNLAQRALADVITFEAADERAIQRGARALARGTVPASLPPRFLVSASSYAVGNGVPARRLSEMVIEHLAKRRSAGLGVAEALSVAA